MRSASLYEVLLVLLVYIAAALAADQLGTVEPLALPLAGRITAGLGAGVGIGIVAALMGVAGGELPIPAIVLLLAVDIKTAGSLSLVVSLPTMLVAFARYSRDGSFSVLGRNRSFVVPWPPAPWPAPSSAACSSASSLLAWSCPCCPAAARLLHQALAAQVAPQLAPRGWPGPLSTGRGRSRASYGFGAPDRPLRPTGPVPVAR